MIDGEGVPIRQSMDIANGDEKEPKSILQRLGVDESAYDLDTHFSAEAMGTSTSCAERVVLVMAVYRKWVELMESANGDDAASKGRGISIIVDDPR